MRRLVVALVAVPLVMTLAGCGGGGGDEGGAAVTPPAGQPAAVPTATPVTELPDRSAPESATVFERFPTGTVVPEALAAKVEAGQPTLILFVNGAQKVTSEVRSAVDRALKENSGVVDLVLFDLGKYASSDEAGRSTVDADALQGDEVGSQAVMLARELEVTGLPYILMTDDQGYIVFRHRGLVDAEYLIMHSERLTD